MAGYKQLRQLATLTVFLGLLGQVVAQATTAPPTPTEILKQGTGCTAMALSMCDVRLSYTVDTTPADNPLVRFTVQTKMDLSNKYIAIGFSADNKMAMSDMVIYNGAKTSSKLTDSYATGRTMPMPDAMQEAVLVSGTTMAGVTTVVFTKPCGSSTNRNLTLDNYYLWAFGAATSTAISQHGLSTATPPGRGVTMSTVKITCPLPAPTTMAAATTTAAATTAASSAGVMQPSSFVAMVVVALAAAQFAF